jgi:hypothetical protein
MAQEPVTFEIPLAGFTAAFERIDWQRNVDNSLHYWERCLRAAVRVRSRHV